MSADRTLCSGAQCIKFLMEKLYWAYLHVWTWRSDRPNIAKGIPSFWNTVNHRIIIIEWFGWEGTFEGHPVHPPAMGRDVFNWIRSLRAPSNVALDVPRDGAATTSLGNPCQDLTTLSVKHFFLLSSLNLPSRQPHYSNSVAFKTVTVYASVEYKNGYFYYQKKRCVKTFFLLTRGNISP